MPMIDIYAPQGTFPDARQLLQQAAATLKEIEEVPDIPMFRANTAAYVHDMPPHAVSNVDGEGDYVRIQVTTNAGALDRSKQIAVVRQLTDLIVSASGQPALAERTWVQLTEATEGGWGLWGHAHTNAELVEAARREISGLAG